MAFGDGDVRTDKQRQTQLPKKFKCRVCEQFKEPGLYAEKELKSYRFMVSQGHRPGPASAQLRCRACAGKQLHEAECKGPCGKWKPLGEFSKSARTINGSNWCIACVMWKEAAESTMTPQAAPIGDLAPDEDPQIFAPSNTANTNLPVLFDPEGGDDYGDDWDDDERFTPATQPAPWGSSTQVRASVPSSAAAPSIAATSVSMAQLSVSSNGWTTQSVHSANPEASRAPASASASHLRGNPGNVAFNMGIPRKASDTATASSASNPYESQSDTASQWSIAGSQARDDAKKNTWGAQNVDRVQNQFSSIARSEVGSAVTSTRTTTTTTTTVRHPAPARASAAVPTAKNSKWAKPAGSRNANKQQQYNALDYQNRSSRQEYNDDDDDM